MRFNLEVDLRVRVSAFLRFTLMPSFDDGFDSRHLVKLNVTAKQNVCDIYRRIHISPMHSDSTRGNALFKAGMVTKQKGVRDAKIMHCRPTSSASLAPQVTYYLVAEDCG